MSTAQIARRTVRTGAIAGIAAMVIAHGLCALYWFTLDPGTHTGSGVVASLIALGLLSVGTVGLSRCPPCIWVAMFLAVASIIPVLLYGV